MLGKNLNVNTVVELNKRINTKLCNNFIYIYYKDILRNSGKVEYYFSYLIKKPDYDAPLESSERKAKVSATALFDNNDFDIVNIYDVDDFYFFRKNDENTYNIYNCNIREETDGTQKVQKCMIENVDTGDICNCLRPDDIDLIILGPELKTKVMEKQHDIIDNNLINDIYDSLGE